MADPYNKKEIADKLNEFYNELDVILSDESIMTIAKKLDKFRDELGEFAQTLEDEVENESENKKETT